MVLWLVVVGLLVAQVAYSPEVFEEHIFNDDFRQNFFWLKSLLDPTYFKDDAIAHYQRDFSSIGMELLYWPLLKAGISPNDASKILSGVFYGGFLFAVYALGRFLDRGRAGFMAPLILIFVLLNNYYFLRFIMGGMARSTAFPLQVMLAVFLLRRKYWAALATTAVCALFHPQTFLVGLGALSMIWAWEALRRLRRRSAWPGLAKRALALIAVAAILGGWLSHKSANTAAKYGRAINAEEIAKSPDYLVGGRWFRERPISFSFELLREVAESHPYNGRGGITIDPSYVTAAFEYVVLICFIVWAMKRNRRLLLRLAPLAILILSSLIFYGIAAAVLAKFYFPNRFIRPIVPIGALVTLVLVSNAAIRNVLARRDLRRSLAFIVATGVLMSIPWRSDNITMYNVSVKPLRDVSKFLKKQPHDVVIAAYPKGDGDNLPLVSNRAVYIGREVSHPLYLGYIEMTRDRHYKTFAAMFPGKIEDVLALRAEGVDYILMRKEMLEDRIAAGDPPSYDEPYDTWLEERFREVPAPQMLGIWNEMIARALAFEDDDYVLIDLRKL